MPTLKGDNIYLRALEPDDLDFVYEIENEESIWEISNTQTPYSRYMLKDYLNNARKDIYEAKQLRLAICKNSGILLGLIDLFDFDFKNRRAGVGLVIKSESDRGKGYGGEALKLLVEYAFTHLNLHQLYCGVASQNTASLKLFENSGFQVVGLKKDWNYFAGGFKDEFLLQLINSNEI